ncbi:MAG: hypothetical protein PHG19_01055 [Anaerotignum sp.]|nr:hypothetical protein [Anaerotignum sp.]
MMGTLLAEKKRHIGTRQDEGSALRARMSAVVTLHGGADCDDPCR